MAQPAASIEICYSEHRDIYVELDVDPTAVVPTLTVASGTVTLKDRLRQVVGSIADVAITGKTAGASAAPKAWYFLQPDVVGMAVGQVYVLTFRLVDSNARVYEPRVHIRVLDDAA